MTAIKANVITIEYEEMGPPDAPVILPIMGLGMQLIAGPSRIARALPPGDFASSASTIAMPGSRRGCRPPVRSRPPR